MSSIGYATAKDWMDIMKNRSKLRMHELIERLGLRAKWSQNKRGKTNFENSLVRDLVTDMGDVVATVPKESDELVKFLQAKGSLSNQVEALLRKHGAAIWGRVGDREHLITPGEPGVEEGLYPRDLYWESEEDREQYVAAGKYRDFTDHRRIRILLHWWLGMKAINVILARDRLDRERRKKEETKRQRLDNLDIPPEGAASTFVPLAPNNGPPAMGTHLAPLAVAEHPRHMELYKADLTSRGSPISGNVDTPPQSYESPIAPGRGSEGGHFAPVHGNSAAPPSQAQSIVEGVWNRLAEVGINGSRNGNMPSQAAAGTPPSWHPADPRRPASLTAAEAAAQGSSSGSNTKGIRELGAEISQLASDLTPGQQGGIPAVTAESARNSVTYPGLDVETLSALRAYIYGEKSEKGEAELDEDILLRRLETAWREGVRSDINRMLENVPTFIARERAFLTWIELKRHLADLQRAGTRT